VKLLYLSSFFFVLCVLALPLMAYNKKDFYRALESKKCLNCDLYRASFNGVDLTNANFSGSNLIGANFQNATLFKADLTDANISGANFEGALWIDGQMCQKGSYGRCIKLSK